MLRYVSPFLCLAVLATRARAQEGPDPDACPPGEVCGQAATLGAWGMIVLGLLFWLVALLPVRGAGEVGDGQGFSLMGRLHKRIDSETTGWRRLQWPVLGLFFIVLGIATLLGGSQR